MLQKKNFTSSKNSVIELFRFICASAIILGHIRKDAKFKAVYFMLGDVGIKFFTNSNVCVEFFFLVSGYFLARTCYTRLTSEEAHSDILAEESAAYLWRKIKRILPYYVFACILCGITLLVRGEPLIKFVWRLPSLFLLHRTGFSDEHIISVSWYLSSMLIAIAIVYPLCRKYYYTFTICVAPVGALLMTGYMIHTTGTLGSVNDWAMITYKCNLRALADISLGTTCFEISRRISNKHFPLVLRIMLSVTAMVFVLIVAVYTCSDISQERSGVMMVLIAVIITVFLSQTGVLGKSKLYDNRLFNYLGGLSLPMYLMQTFFRELAKEPFGYMDKTEKLVFIYVGTLLSAMLLYAIIGRVMRTRHSR